MNSVTSTTVSWQGNILSCVCLSLTSHFFNHLIAVTIFHFIIHFCCISFIYQLWWSRGSMLAFGTEVRGFKPGWSRRIFKGEKILSTPSFGGEVKPSVPRRRFAACKISLELCGSRILDKICRNISRPRVPPFTARGLSHRWTWRHLAEKVGMSKGRGKQWQPTPKNLPRMQCARAISVTWLGSGSC